MRGPAKRRSKFLTLVKLVLSMSKEGAGGFFLLLLVSLDSSAEYLRR